MILSGGITTAGLLSTMSEVHVYEHNVNLNIAWPGDYIRHYAYIGVTTTLCNVEGVHNK